MNRVIGMFVFCALVLPVAAQVMPLQLDVKPQITKKDVSVTFANGASYVQSRALKITLHNSSPRPVTGVTVRWGIVKLHQSVTSNSKNPGTEAYGAEEKFDLKPLETISKPVEGGGDGHRRSRGPPV